VELQRPVLHKETLIQARESAHERALFHRQNSKGHAPFLRQESLEKGRPHSASCEGHRPAFLRQESAPLSGSHSPRLLENWSPSFLGIGEDGRIRSFSFSSPKRTASSKNAKSTPKKKQAYKSVDMFRG
jgi:hypothetical protein